MSKDQKLEQKAKELIEGLTPISNWDSIESYLDFRIGMLGEELAKLWFITKEDIPKIEDDEERKLAAYKYTPQSVKVHANLHDLLVVREFLNK